MPGRQLFPGVCYRVKPYFPLTAQCNFNRHTKTIYHPVPPVIECVTLKHIFELRYPDIFQVLLEDQGKIFSTLPVDVTDYVITVYGGMIKFPVEPAEDLSPGFIIIDDLPDGIKGTAQIEELICFKKNLTASKSGTIFGCKMVLLGALAKKFINKLNLEGQFSAMNITFVKAKEVVTTVKRRVETAEEDEDDE